ncbi:MULTISPECIES: tail fiber assembly protein [Photorhabdus]|uniref:Tail fiber assembly protein n=1 Tax=Photorhabdus kayaii TaxID=230088 RepID=A0ABX0AV77_9GAMM|nr:MULTISPECIES: tail fiber assembly protein [Photorhabdus]MCC8376313.1 tail fiber assembly protein [Photorhabdus bodei]MCT8350299.1 tail fiber assembly protein [Photorhabdus kayaii]MDB6367794.1 tail fiber assembly protein [Photorhabdus bodei]NDL12123.1 tail fiber assembly protein [Photorhabdus kayaii]NDL24661.1 tail fiber assembly protein [Photorhabdus kayaii]
MINYYFDNTKLHRPFIGAVDANPGSEPPVNALRIQPLFKDGFWPCEKSGQWELVENKKGIMIYDIESGQSQENREVIIPDGFIEQPRPSQYHRWNGEWSISKDDEERWKNDIQQVVINDAENKRQQLLFTVNKKVTPLQDAVDLDIATEAEKDALLIWKKYRVMLNRIDISQAPNIEWPEQPK